MRKSSECVRNYVLMRTNPPSLNLQDQRQIITLTRRWAEVLKKIIQLTDERNRRA